MSLSFDQSLSHLKMTSAGMSRVLSQFPESSYNESWPTMQGGNDSKSWPSFSIQWDETNSIDETITTNYSDKTLTSNNGRQVVDAIIRSMISLKRDVMSVTIMATNLLETFSINWLQKHIDNITRKGNREIRYGFSGFLQDWKEYRSMYNKDPDTETLETMFNQNSLLRNLHYSNPPSQDSTY